MPRPERQGVMLAYPATENRVFRLPKTLLVQPKLRGERCKVEFQEGKSYLISSYGNPYYFLNHIEDELNKLAKNYFNWPFDGEIYVHGWSQERINSAANRTKNKSPESHLLEYHIFDLCYKTMNQVERLSLLHHALAEEIERLGLKYIKVVPTSIIKNQAWERSAVIYTEQGYEGIIIRNIDASGYVPKRTNDLLKFKPTEIDYYRIEDVLEAISEEGVGKDMVGSFLVSSSETDVFKVSAGRMSHKLRAYFWLNRNQIIGKNLEVKHEKIRTKNNVPLCCVAINVVK